MSHDTGVRNVVLVHGGFVDGSGWQAVYDRAHRRRLQRRASCRTRRCPWTATSPRPGRSSTPSTARWSWSATPTAAWSSPRPAPTRTWSALVYIAAFAPDKGESVNTLIADPPPGAPVPPILPPNDGFLFLDRDKFADVVRRRPARRAGRVHGRLAGPVGRRRARGCRDRPRLAQLPSGTSWPPTTR